MRFKAGDKVRPLICFTNLPYQVYTIESCEVTETARGEWCSFTDANGVYDPKSFELALTGPEEEVRQRTLEGVLEILRVAESVPQAIEHIKSMLEMSRAQATPA
jgi:hypothetical protein